MEVGEETGNEVKAGERGAVQTGFGLAEDAGDYVEADAYVLASP